MIDKMNILLHKKKKKELGDQPMLTASTLESESHHITSQPILVLFY